MESVEKQSNRREGSRLCISASFPFGCEFALFDGLEEWIDEEERFNSVEATWITPFKSQFYKT